MTVQILQLHNDKRVQVMLAVTFATTKCFGGKLRKESRGTVDWYHQHNRLRLWVTIKPCVDG